MGGSAPRAREDSVSSRRQSSACARPLSFTVRRRLDSCSVGTFGGIVFGIILPLAAFYIFVSIFSDGVESQARWKIFAVAAVATFLLSGISRSSPTLVGSVMACSVAAAVSFAGLIFWTKVTRLQAFKITGSYIGFVIGYSLVVGLIFGHHTA